MKVLMRFIPMASIEGSIIVRRRRSALSREQSTIPRRSVSIIIQFRNCAEYRDVRLRRTISLSASRPRRPPGSASSTGHCGVPGRHQELLAQVALWGAIPGTPLVDKTLRVVGNSIGEIAQGPLSKRSCACLILDEPHLIPQRGRQRGAASIA